MADGLCGSILRFLYRNDSGPAALFFRPVGFDYRSKLESPKWRGMWDWGIFIGSFVPSLVIGVAFGNLLQGVPVEVNSQLQVSYAGASSVC